MMTKKIEVPTLRVKLLSEHAYPPVCSNPGEDLGYDLYAAYDTTLWVGRSTKIHTGIAVELPGYGFLIRDRSSMAARGIIVSGGVIDAGYRGEIVVVLTNLSTPTTTAEFIRAGDKIAQMIPFRPETHWLVSVVKQLSGSDRGSGGFGSTGR